jgi:hypothetical protein
MNQQKKQPPAKLATDSTALFCRPKKKIFAATSPKSDRASEFKLVVAYDDFGNGICATEFLKRLAESFGEILTFVPRFLKFEELLELRVRELLVREVAVADMVVFVADEHVTLPDSVENWIRTWETTAGIEDLRLLALFSTSHRDNDRMTPVQWRLRQAARRTGMKFVLQATPLSGRGCRVADPNPATTRQAGERRGKWRKSCSAREWPEKAVPRAIAGGMTHDLPHTAVTDAIIHVLQARRRRTSPPTCPFTNDRRKPPPGMNRNHTLINL